jgi:hypothetical protein
MIRFTHEMVNFKINNIEHLYFFDKKGNPN